MTPSAASRPRAAFQTLGCRLNQTESAILAELLAGAGFEIVPWGETAEALVVNSCAVTTAAVQKTRYAVRTARRRFPAAVVAVVGCGVAADPEGWRRRALADLVLDTREKNRLAECLREALGRDWELAAVPLPPPAGPDSFREPTAGLFAGRTRASLKIQEGCDFGCSYCIVPQLRGAPRSRDWEDAVAGFAELRRRGYREIVLTGVNVATYNDRGRTLPDLVARLLEFPGDFRLRLSSTEPGPAVRGVAGLMRQDRRLCRFLHLSAQHLEDGVLARMRRRYTAGAYAELVEALAEEIPGICIGTDFIVGFPGETEAAFAAALERLAALPIAHVHGFSFSPRPGTVAAALPEPVPERVAAERLDRLKGVAAAKAAAFVRSQVGATLRVLLEEGERQGLPRGWSDNYLDVTVRGAAGRRPNQFVDVRITEPGDEEGIAWGECLGAEPMDVA